MMLATLIQARASSSAIIVYSKTPQPRPPCSVVDHDPEVALLAHRVDQAARHLALLRVVLVGDRLDLVRRRSGAPRPAARPASSVRYGSLSSGAGAATGSSVTVAACLHRASVTTTPRRCTRGRLPRWTAGTTGGPGAAHIIVCGLDDVGAARRRAAAPGRRSRSSSSTTSPTRAGSPTSRRARRARTSPRSGRRAVRRSRRPASTGAAALICADRRRPGEPRDRAAGPAAATATCGSSCSSATPRWAARSAASPARTACWTSRAIAAPTLAEACLDLHAAADRPRRRGVRAARARRRARTARCASSSATSRPIAVVPGRRRRHDGLPRPRPRGRRRRPGRTSIGPPHDIADRGRLAPRRRCRRTAPAAGAGRHAARATSAASSPRASARCG